MRVQIVCPKCQLERKPGAESCARCGLLVARWEGFLVELPSHPPVDAAWKTLEKSWEDDAAHRLFVERAAEVQGLDVAAALYREARRTRPQDARAEAGLRRTVALAESLYAARSLADRTRAPSGLLRVFGLVGAIVVVLSAIGALLFVLRHR